MKHPLDIGQVRLGRKEPSLQRIVIASAVLHLLFISLVIIPIKTGEREFKSYYVKLVGPIQVPGTGRGPLPARRRRTLPPKKTGKKLSAKETVKTPPSADMSLEPADKVAKEIERIRAIQALAKKKAGEKAKEQIEVTGKGAEEETAGGTGIPGGEAPAYSDSYYALITQKIWSQWVYPELSTSGLEIIISIKIDKDGKIISREIEKSSGNRLFDRSAIKAVTNASPLPAPPFEMEIGVRFHI